MKTAALPVFDVTALRAEFPAFARYSLDGRNLYSSETM